MNNFTCENGVRMFEQYYKITISSKYFTFRYMQDLVLKGVAIGADPGGGTLLAPVARIQVPPWQRCGSCRRDPPRSRSSYPGTIMTVLRLLEAGPSSLPWLGSRYHYSSVAAPRGGSHLAPVARIQVPP